VALRKLRNLLFGLAIAANVTNHGASPWHSCTRSATIYGTVSIFLDGFWLLFGPARCIMALEKELASFDRELPRLVQTMKGQFALIHGEAIDSSWKTEDEAYTAGCERFGTEPFLVMLVEELEPPLPVFQDVRPHAAHP
jgi:hypothetical protein